MRTIYMFSRLDISCPLIPDTLDVNDIEEFREWLSRDPGDYSPLPFHNGLKLFLWVINEYCHLERT